MKSARRTASAPKRYSVLCFMIAVALIVSGCSGDVLAQIDHNAHDLNDIHIAQIAKQDDTSPAAVHEVINDFGSQGKSSLRIYTEKLSSGDAKEVIKDACDVRGIATFVKAGTNQERLNFINSQYSASFAKIKDAADVAQDVDNLAQAMNNGNIQQLVADVTCASV